MSKEFICIVCPRGCHLTIDDAMKVTGNQCPRGVAYAQKEITAPERMLTSTVVIDSAFIKRLPVRTSSEVPKNQMMNVMQCLNEVRVRAPIQAGEVIIKNILGLPVDIIATRSILK